MLARGKGGPRGIRGILRAGACAGLSLTIALSGMPTMAFAEMTEEVAAAQEASVQADALGQAVREAALQVTGETATDKVASAYALFAGITIAEAEEEADVDAEALAALGGEASTAAGVTRALVLVLREAGVGAQEVKGADGSVWAMTEVDGSWSHVDAAAAAGAEDASWLSLDDATLAERAPERAPWTLADGTEAPAAVTDEEAPAEEETEVAATDEEAPAEEAPEEEQETTDEEAAEEVAEDEAETVELTPVTEEEAKETESKTKDEKNATKADNEETLAQKLNSESGLTDEPGELSTQSVTEKTLSLNGQWQYYTPTGYDLESPTLYRFTLSKASKFKLVFENRNTKQADWELLDNDNRQLDDGWASQNNTSSLSTYLKAGNYSLRVHPHYSAGTGEVMIKATATAATHPVRSNTTYDEAVALTRGNVTKSLVTLNDKSDTYYTFSISGTKEVKITGQESDSDYNTLYDLYVYNANKEYVSHISNILGAKTLTLTLTGGKYYIRTTHPSSGPYTVKYTTTSNSVADASVSVHNRTYNGNSQTPAPTVTLNGITLTKDVDYTVSLSSRVNAGTYNVTIKGIGKYNGSKTVAWKINKASVAKASVSLAYTKHIATGKQLKPGTTVKVGSHTLTRNTDYTVSYGTNKNIGTGTLTIKGRGNCTGSIKKTFKIVKSTGSVTYRTHVQSDGDQAWKKNGQTSGTMGQSKRLEGIWIKLDKNPVGGSVQYRTHVQSYGWETSWRSNGQMSGTSGQSKRLEAIQIKLTGNMAKSYDVYYRVHAQTFGWMGWAKNGAMAGTAGYSKRLEGIQIKLVRKGGAAPGSTANPYLSR